MTRPDVLHAKAIGMVYTDLIDEPQTIEISGSYKTQEILRAMVGKVCKIKSYTYDASTGIHSIQLIPDDGIQWLHTLQPIE